MIVGHVLREEAVGVGTEARRGERHAQLAVDAVEKPVLGALARSSSCARTVEAAPRGDPREGPGSGWTGGAWASASRMGSLSTPSTWLTTPQVSRRAVARSWSTRLPPSGRLTLTWALAIEISPRVKRR